MRRAEQAHFREHAIMWDKQQTVHEDLTREYRLLLSSKQELEEKVGTTTKNNNTLRERLATRTTEIRVLTEQLEEQRDTHLLSEDDKIIEITKLRKDKAEANVEKERALKNAKSAEATLEYTKEQYRQAQEAATNSASTTAVLEAQIAKLSHAASGERTKLKSLHFGRQHENLAAQIKNLKAENTIVRQALKVKEDELARAKLSGGRMGVGTRATSATPQPKTRSRAASPMRLSNLRNG
jgi:chromosome segregation ATPase